MRWEKSRKKCGIGLPSMSKNHLCLSYEYKQCYCFIKVAITMPIQNTDGYIHLYMMFDDYVSDKLKKTKPNAPTLLLTFISKASIFVVHISSQLLNVHFYVSTNRKRNLI